MRNLFSTKVKIILVVAALLTAALAIYSGISNQSLPSVIVQGVLAPFRAAGTTLTNTAEKYYSYMFRYEALDAENKVLEERIAQMEDVARQADSVSRENERLRKLLELKATNEDYKLVDAYIIGWSSSDWESTFTINRGTNAGIRENLCAITANGEVVGLVTEVGVNYAVVKTVLDSTLEISGTISTSGYNGMVKGGYIDGNEKFLKMDYLPSAAIIRNNQEVVTSGSVAAVVSVACVVSSVGSVTVGSTVSWMSVSAEGSMSSSAWTGIRHPHRRENTHISASIFLQKDISV